MYSNCGRHKGMTVKTVNLTENEEFLLEKKAHTGLE
jgi:hypothetical protein